VDCLPNEVPKNISTSIYESFFLEKKKVFLIRSVLVKSIGFVNLAQIFGLIPSNYAFSVRLIEITSLNRYICTLFSLNILLTD